MLHVLLVSLALLGSSAKVLADTVEIENGKAALTDGSVRRGRFLLERSAAGKVTISVRERTRQKRLRRVVLLVDAEGAAVYPDPPTLDALPGFRFLAADENPEHPADALLRFATRIAGKENPLRAALFVEALTVDPAHEATLRALDGMSVAERLPIYRKLIEVAPDHFDVEEAVRRCLPEDLPFYGQVDVEGWILFLEIAERLSVTILTDPDDPAPEWKAEKRKLGQAINTRLWEEEDLVGYRTEHLYLISSIHDPRLLAGCLGRGEAVVRALTEMFAPGEAKRAGRYPLLVFLYSSPEEYEEKGRNTRERGRQVAHNDLGGRYSAVDSTTRVYFPGGEDAVVRVQEVLAHELTHHWMHRCCPGITATEAASVATRSGPERPGKWAEEGFAAVMQDLVFDEEGTSFESANPRSHLLDILANARRTDLVPWEEVFRGTSTDFDRLRTTGGIQVGSRLRPEYLYRVTEHHLYFAQVAGACGYLFGRDATTRADFLAYLLAYYRNDVDALDVRRTLGLSEAELGKQARLYASDVCRSQPR